MIGYCRFQRTDIGSFKCFLWREFIQPSYSPLKEYEYTAFHFINSTSGGHAEYVSILLFFSVKNSLRI